MTRALRVTAPLLAALFVSGCQKDEPTGPIAAVERGEQLFRDPGFSTSSFNAFACSTCHASDPADNTIHPGYSLVDGAFRTSYWGGYEPRLIDAVSFCLVFFMRGDPLEPDDPSGRALYEYLASLSPEGPEPLAPVRPLTVALNIREIDRGDPVRGAEVWDQACHVCHGEPHTGRGRISDDASIVPEDSMEFADEVGYPIDQVITEKIRHGQFFGVGGNMPLFSLETLSDEDIGALLAYIDAD
jgi:thiosulfate dehydrogenase